MATRPKFTEETILSVAKTTLSNARNNLEALSEFGLTDEMLNQFEKDIQDTEALPDETANRIELRNLTTDKEEALDACHQWGRKLRARMQLAFGRNSSQANAFPSGDFNDARNSESGMMPVMEILTNLSEQYQNELSEYGQTPEVIARGKDLLQQLRETDRAQELQKDAKKAATQERYKKFQHLYDMVNRINKIGRIVFDGDPVHLALFDSKWPSSATADQKENTM